MASDAPAANSSIQDSMALGAGADRSKALRDRTFFLRVAHANGVLSNQIRDSTIKLVESQKLLAEVDALLRR